MECAACANDGFEKKEIKSKTIFIHKFLEFCYFLVFELRNQHDCVEEQEEGIMNGDYIMGNEMFNEVEIDEYEDDEFLSVFLKSFEEPCSE